MNFVIYETDERMFLLKNELDKVTPPATTHVFAPNIALNEKNTAETECFVMDIVCDIFYLSVCFYFRNSFPIKRKKSFIFSKKLLNFTMMPLSVKLL